MRSMPARVRRIKLAIESREDFTGLANGGEAEVFRYARSIGMRGGELVIQWQQTFRQRQAQAANARPAGRAAVLTESRLDDLDYWRADYERAANRTDDLDPCQCPSPECRAGDCAACSDPDCDDPNCVEGDREEENDEEE